MPILKGSCAVCGHGRKTGLPQEPTRPDCAHRYARPGQRSIPAAKFRHSAELISATKAALVSPPNALRIHRRPRRKRAGAILCTITEFDPFLLFVVNCPRQ